MAITPGDIRVHLLHFDAEYQRLVQEHTRCEKELEELQNRKYLNSEDMILEIVLKKRKLHLKDEMEKLVLNRQRATALH